MNPNRGRDKKSTGQDSRAYEEPRAGLLFRVSNQHGPDAVQPPSIDGDDPATLCSTFQNRYGEQSLFVAREGAGQAELWCGDAGWGPYAVVDGRAEGLILASEELVWLRACWLAAADLIGRPQE